MHYVHHQSNRNDTIVALATPPGMGGIAIVRISGKRAIEIASLSAKAPLIDQASHTAKLYPIFSYADALIDRALILVMRSPKSFTGEDVVEIHCHGGHLISRRVIESLALLGARPAEPGEFSMRAFLNGKIDLAQAEAIQSLIGAQSEEALKVAEAQLEGRLSHSIKALQIQGTRIAAIFEAWVDFPEEGLEFAPFEEVCEEIQEMKKSLETLLRTYRDGKIIRDGISLAFVGAPNAGKSSLMNALLGKNRAIVSPIPGTTRDIVEDDATFHGVSFRLIDTAGIRTTDELIEEEGIRRSKQAIERADIVLAVCDVTQPEDRDMLNVVQNIPKGKSLVVWNKIDLLKEPYTIGEKFSIGMPEVYVSAETKEGFVALHRAVDRIVWSQGALPRDEVMITSVRHKNALGEALQSLSKVIDGLLLGESPEFLVFDMKSALKSLGTIIGTDITEDILTSIFSQFCIGK